MVRSNDKQKLTLVSKRDLLAIEGPLDLQARLDRKDLLA